MHSKEHMQWLEKHNLLELAKSNSVHLKNALKECLGVKKEEVLIVSDRGSEESRISGVLSASYYLALKDMGYNAKLVVQEQKIKGDTADDAVIDALSDLPYESVLILCLSGVLGRLKELGLSFRNFIKERKHRFISTTRLGNLSTDKFPVLVKAIDIDYKKLKGKGEKLKELFNNGKEVRVITDSGTDLTIGLDKDKAIANIGDYRTPGRGGNMPAGEIYMPPKWRKVEGQVMIDCSGSYRWGTQLIKKPIKLVIEKGEIVDLTGGKEAEKLKETLDWAFKKAKYPWGIRRIGELGIGINPNAEVIGATIVDEKSLGTAHVAIGSNYWFGGTIYAIIHLDQIFRNPKIYLDNEEIDVSK